jgi:hypothetical protein
VRADGAGVTAVSVAMELGKYVTVTVVILYCGVLLWNVKLQDRNHAGGKNPSHASLMAICNKVYAKLVELKLRWATCM